MGSPRQKEPSGSQNNSTTHYHGRHRRRSKNKRQLEPITTEVAPGNSTSLFTPQQQKTIIEHQMITKNQHSSQKAYAHVPCKFFRQGACQAGDSCPFSHSLDASTADRTPCEYFRRGNCKFGNRCANAHILPTRKSPEQAVIDEEEDEDEEDPNEADFPHHEEFYIPTDFADLLTPEELKRRNSRSSSTTSFSAVSLGASLSSSSAASSYSATAASPLLHQQLAYFQPATVGPPAKGFSPWSPTPQTTTTATTTHRNSFSWLLGDLASLRIEEEEPLVYTSYDATTAANHQDTQFLFDDLPDHNRFN